MLVLPSRRTLDAADAALAEVCFVFFGILKSPFLDLSTTYNIMRDKSRKMRKIILYIVSVNKEGKISPAEIILREAEKLPWDEWQCIVKAMEFVHRKRADKLTLDDSEKTHEELMFHVEHY